MDLSQCFEAKKRIAERGEPKVSFGGEGNTTDGQGLLLGFGVTSSPEIPCRTVTKRRREACSTWLQSIKVQRSQDGALVQRENSTATRRRWANLLPRLAQTRALIIAGCRELIFAAIDTSRHLTPPIIVSSGQISAESLQSHTFATLPPDPTTSYRLSSRYPFSAYKLTILPRYISTSQPCQSRRIPTLETPC